MTAPVNFFGLNPIPKLNSQTGTSYTFVAADAGQLVPLTNAAAITATIPPNSSVAFKIGTTIEGYQGGAGAITFAPGSGVTLVTPSGLATAGIYARYRLQKIATDTWLVTISSFSNVIARNATELSVSTSASKTTVWSFTVPANKLGTDKTLAIELGGKAQFNSGTPTLTVTVEYGGTTLYADVCTGQTAAAGVRAWFLNLNLSAHGATNSQVLTGMLAMGPPGGATTGNGDIAAAIASATGFNAPIYGTSAEDSTADKTLTISFTMSVSNSADNWQRENAIAYMKGEGQKGDTGAAGSAGATGAPGGVTSPVTALSTSGTVNIDCSLGNYFTLTPTGNVTSITFSNLPSSGNAQTILLRFTQAIAVYTVAWPASFKWAGGVAGAVSTTGGKKDLIAFTTHDQGTTWFASIANDFS